MDPIYNKQQYIYSNEWKSTNESKISFEESLISSNLPDSNDKIVANLVGDAFISGFKNWEGNDPRNILNFSKETLKITSEKIGIDINKNKVLNPSSM